MGEAAEQGLEEDIPPALRRRALLPVVTNVTENTPDDKMPRLSQDELVIQQRGRRRKPITWSPVDYNKSDLLGPPRDKTPDKVSQRAEISSKLRRRLVMSPSREPPSGLGDAIAKKLRAISNINR